MVHPRRPWTQRCWHCFLHEASFLHYQVPVAFVNDNECLSKVSQLETCELPGLVIRFRTSEFQTLRNRIIVIGALFILECSGNATVLQRPLFYFSLSIYPVHYCIHKYDSMLAFFYAYAVRACMPLADTTVMTDHDNWTNGLTWVHGHVIQ